jgi:hypothetical protein
MPHLKTETILSSTRQRHLRSFCAILLVALLPACSDNVNAAPQDAIVGADRTDNGCIPSAGYQWSGVLGECIRLWETATELTHQGSGDPDYSAYAIMNGEEAELFLPDTQDPILLFEDVGTGNVASWTDATSEYNLTFDPSAALIVTDQTGFVMYRDMSADQIIDEIPIHASDELGGDFVMDRGVVTRVEDGVYPMYTVDIRLEEDTEPTTFSLIVEGASITGAPIDDMVSKSVAIEYVDKDVWDLTYIDSSGAEGAENIEIGEGWRFVTGRLSGAAEVTGSDLPDLVTIELMGGESIEFEYYIDPEMSALNDTDVSAWLAPRNSKELLSIAVIP